MTKTSQRQLTNILQNFIKKKLCKNSKHNCLPAQNDVTLHYFEKSTIQVKPNIPCEIIATMSHSVTTWLFLADG